MNNKKSSELSEKMINRIISVAYGDAGLLDKLLIWHAAKKDNKIKKLLDSYRTTANEVHKIEEDVFPQEIIKALKEKNINSYKTINNFATDFLSIVFAKPLVSAAATFILIGVIAIALMQNRTVKYKYTQSEIETAHQKAKQAFAIIGKIFNETKNTLHNDIVGEKIGKPINESYEIINDLFNKGGKQ